MAPDEAADCEQILRSLPQWFGIEASIVAYAREIATMETYVAEASGVVVGFISVNPRSPVAAEVHVMAVREESHGRGIGRALMARVEEVLAGRSTEYLQVKTLGPSRPNAEYARTRGFYERLGFAPLEENNLWGDVNPCLIMVKHLGCRGGGSSPSTAEPREIKEDLN